MRQRFYHSCEVCSGSFSLPLCRISNGQKIRFCSAECRKKGMVGPNRSDWKREEKNCIICNSKFYVKQKVIKSGGGKYCSVSCKHKGQGSTYRKTVLSNRTVKSCVVCNCLIYIKPSQANRAGTYCSKQCQNKAYKDRFSGANNPNFKDAGYSGSKYSSFASKRRRDAKKTGDHTERDWEQLVLSYSGCCACCKESGKKLTKDHIRPISKGGNNSIGNIQPLCFRCNLKKSAKHVVYQQQLVLPL